MWSIRCRRATAWATRLGQARVFGGRAVLAFRFARSFVFSPFRSIRPLACIAREIEMLLRRKNAVIYGAGGAVGGAVARTFAREGANVFLAGRRLESIDMVAKEIAADGGVVEIAQVDALDENAVEQHIDAIAKEVDRIDVVFNAIGFDSRQ